MTVMSALDLYWLDSALRLHCRVATAAISGFCLLALAGVTFSPDVQSFLLLSGIITVGFPHGAFDYLVARPVLAQRLGPYWWFYFGIGYFGLAGAVWITWAVAPAMTLIGFLMASVLHFGLGDIEDGLAPKTVPRAIAIFGYGGLPILMPIAIHPQACAPLLAALAKVPVSTMVNALAAVSWWMPVWIIAFAWIMLANLREHRTIVERLATVVAMVLLPPVLAFGLYFTIGHSVRHLLRLGAWHEPRDLAVATRWLRRVIAPAGVLCALGITGLVLMAGDITIDVLTPCFQVIAVLTLPHMIVTGWLEHSKVGKLLRPVVPQLFQLPKNARGLLR